MSHRLPPPSPPLRAALARVLLLALSLAPAAARAQAAGDVTPPTVTITSSVGISTTDASATITINWCDPTDPSVPKQSGLVSASRQILFNNGNVTTTLFGYATSSVAGCYSAATSTGTVSLVLGSNSINASIKDNAGFTGSASLSITRAALPPPPNPLSVIAKDPKMVDPSRCVADCFEATLAYSTPAYVSRDASRALTLLYRSGRAAPRGIVRLDATDSRGIAGTKFRLQLRNPSNANTIVKFYRWDGDVSGADYQHYAAGTGYTTLLGQFDASDTTQWKTGYYPLTAEVVSEYPDGTLSSPVNVTVGVVILNV